MIVARVYRNVDLTAHGSGRTGATNVLRTGRKGLAAATLIGDALKGTLAVIIVMWVDMMELPLVAGLGAFAGHLYPVWLKFNGGKGVATYIGILIALAWPAAMAFCGIWLVIAALTRYSSLAALVASAATPVLLWIGGGARATLLFTALTVVLWIRHRENIARLFNGTEGKIGRKAS